MKYLFSVFLLIAAASSVVAAEKTLNPQQQAVKVVKDSTRWLEGPTMAGYEEGCRILTEALQNAKGGARCGMMIQKAEWLRAMKKYAEADALAVQCLQEFPKMHVRDHGRMIGVRAGCLFDHGKWAEALALYSQIDPKAQHDYLPMMAKAAMALGKYKDAETYLEQCVKRGRNQQRAYGAALENLKKRNASAE